MGGSTSSHRHEKQRPQCRGNKPLVSRASAVTRAGDKAGGGMETDKFMEDFDRHVKAFRLYP